MAKSPANHGREWTRDAERQMKQLVKENTPTRVMALKLGRTPAAIYNKAQELGISLKPTNQRPRGKRR